MKNSKLTKTANKLRNKISKNSELGNEIAKVNEVEKEVTLKEIMFLHQSDLEALESSNERCQSKHTNLKSNHHKSKESIKTNKKRYKQRKVFAKGILYVRQTQRVRNERQSRK